MTTCAPVASTMSDSAVTIEWAPSDFTLDDRQRRGQFVTSDDGPGVVEPLISVDDAGEVDSRVGRRQQLLQGALLDDHRKGGRGHDVAVA